MTPEPDKWNCGEGKVKDQTKILEHIRDVAIDACKTKCLEHELCYTMDFSNTGEYKTSSSCGLYGHEAEIIDNNAAGSSLRVYCQLGKYNSFEYITAFGNIIRIYNLINL